VSSRNGQNEPEKRQFSTWWLGPRQTASEGTPDVADPEMCADKPGSFLGASGQVSVE